MNINRNLIKINGNSNRTYEDDHALYSTFDYTDLHGDDHLATSADTPLRKDAFSIPDEEKIKIISHHFSEIMKTLGLDLKDDSLKGTPMRVAKMYVNEIFSGLDPKRKPVPRLFRNKFGYDGMLVEKDILVQSYCEHHFVPITGKAHVAYFPNGKVIGLSKINRVVQYYARRPQVQERLSVQIAEELKKILDTEDVAVVVEANHMCVSLRGIRDINSSTVTTYFGGKFKDPETKRELLYHLGASAEKQH